MLRQRIGWIISLMVVIGVMVSGIGLASRTAIAQDDDEDPTNLLKNGNMGRPYYSQGSAVQTAPLGWSLWVGAGTPEAFPHNDGVQIRKGNESWNLHQPYVAFTAAGYQRVTGFKEGAVLKAMAYGWVYTCDNLDTSCVIEEAPYRRSDTAAGVTLKVGLDPTGGTDPNADTVQWSTTAAPYDKWAQMSVTATAKGDAVTVFLYMSQQKGLAMNDVYWDEASLRLTEEAPPDAPTPVPEVPFVTPQGVRPDGSIVHVVQEGDTLSSIAYAYNIDYGVTVASIAEINDGIKPNTRYLRLGQEILILPPGSVDPVTGALIPPGERDEAAGAEVTEEATESADSTEAADVETAPTNNDTGDASSDATEAPGAEPTEAVTQEVAAAEAQPTATEEAAFEVSALPTEESEAEPTEEPTPEPAEEPTEEPTVEPTEEPAAEPAESPTEESEPVAVAMAEPPAGDEAVLPARLASPTGALCITLFDDVNTNLSRDADEAPLPGGQIMISQPDSAESAYDYDGSDPLCMDLPAGQYNVLAHLPADYGLTTADSALVSLAAGRQVSVSFGGAMGYTPPAAPADTGDTDITVEDIETGAVAPMVEVVLESEDEEKDILDRLYDNSGLLVLGFAGVVMISSTLLLLAVRRFGS
ncbi:MAG: LysM peptidoglycan-binding domain-containing protein [Anaerolineae bacterium]|nr:LysM peptidoglycan-binding domain-containing protein [Anaerolineae bacterium]